MPKLLYIAYSSHSGSTLLSLLLNTHPKIVSAGHMTGWDAGEEDFYCSCGQSLDDCPFFQYVAQAFRAAQLPFSTTNFGTDYKLSPNVRLNRYLLGPLPGRNAAVESGRDRLVGALPGLAAKLTQIDRANLTFIAAAGGYSGAQVVVDKSTKSFRLRRLKRIRDLDLSVLHLIQDPRAVIHSDIQGRGWSARRGIENWLVRNQDILRDLGRAQSHMTVFYDDLCDRTDPALAEIHRFAGLEPAPFPGDFKVGEHHVLGNDMRHGSPKIRKDLRWQEQMAAEDLAVIEGGARDFAGQQPDHPLSTIIRRYLET